MQNYSEIEGFEAGNKEFVFRAMHNKIVNVYEDNLCFGIEQINDNTRLLSYVIVKLCLQAIVTAFKVITAKEHSIRNRRTL